MANPLKLTGLIGSKLYYTYQQPDITQTSTSATSPNTLKTITFTAATALPFNGNRVEWVGSFRLVKSDESAFYVGIYINGNQIEEVSGIPSAAATGGNFQISLRRKDATNYIYSSNIGFGEFGEPNGGLIAYAGADFTIELKGSVDNAANSIVSFDAELIGGGGY